MTSLYGNRVLGNGDDRFHDGIDIVGIGNITLLSPIDGNVISSQIITNKSNLTWQWGHYVCVQSKDKFKHYFCHLASRNVKVGDTVKKGDVIGIMGNTGYSFGSHTHYGIRNLANQWINPLEYYKLYLKENMIYNLSDIFKFEDSKSKTFTYVEAVEYVKKEVNLANDTITYMKGYKYCESLFIKLANLIYNKPLKNKSISKTILYIFKDISKLEDETIKYLSNYKYGNDLINKLILAMK